MILMGRDESDSEMIVGNRCHLVKLDCWTKAWLKPSAIEMKEPEKVITQADISLFSICLQK